MSRLGGRIARAEYLLRGPDPEAEAREEDFRRSAAILEELGRHSPLSGRPDLDRLIEESVVCGLSGYGLSQEEVEALAPAYAKDFKAMIRDLDEAEGQGYAGGGPWAR